MKKGALNVEYIRVDVNNLTDSNVAKTISPLLLRLSLQRWNFFLLYFVPRLQVFLSFHHKYTLFASYFHPRKSKKWYNCSLYTFLSFFKLPRVLNWNMCRTFFIWTIASATSLPDLATIVLARFRPTILLQSHASDEAENMKS